MKRSSTTILSEWRMLLLSRRSRDFAVTESALSQPAAIASSGFKSITQKISRPPFSRVNSAARYEIKGGEVSATTTSWRGVKTKRAAQAIMKLVKPSARRQRDFLPALIAGTRLISTFCQSSRRANRRPASSYPRRPAMTLTLCPRSERPAARSADCWAVATTSGQKH